MSPTALTPSDAKAVKAAFRDFRDADPLALTLLSQLRPASAVDRMLVWRALSPRIDGALSEKGHQALDAARACFADICEPHPGRPERPTDRALSEREYEAWYAREKAAGRRWPSVSSVRNWLGGSWPSVQEALGQNPSVTATALRLAAIGGEATEEDLKGELLASRTALAIERSGPDAEPLAYINQRTHREWVYRELAKPKAERALPRLHTQPHVFRRVFGSWPEAIIASGGGGPEAMRALARVKAHEDKKDYSREDCIAALQRVGQSEGDGASMGWRDYKKRAHSIRITAAEAGQARKVRLPSPQTIVDRLGSWPEALHAAGFIDEWECALRLARVTTSRTDPELKQVFAEALVVLGAAATRGSYLAEREARQEANGGRADWPSWATLYQRLGKFDDAVATTLEAHPEVLDEWDAQQMAAGEVRPA